MLLFLNCSIIGYNNCYDKNWWVWNLLKQYKRSSVLVRFHPHAEIQTHLRNIDVDRIVQTIRNGRLLQEKCTKPDRIAFKMFFKEGYTYVVIAKTLPNSFQVRTVWKQSGRI